MYELLHPAQFAHWYDALWWFFKMDCLLATIILLAAILWGLLSGLSGR